MKYTKLGNSDIMVSQFAVGCMSFGVPFPDTMQWTLNEKESEAMVKQALDLGINFFDTSNNYARGTSEEFLGKAVRNLTTRDKVVIASKVHNNPGKLSREAILREIDGTLKRLGTDYLDLYIIHRFDYGTPMEETMETLHSLVQAGKVRALGASAMYGYQFMNLQLIAEKNGWTKFVSMQNHYNLIYREDERELIPVCKQWGVALTPYSPLARGHLCRTTWKSGSKRDLTDKITMGHYDATEAADMVIVNRVHDLAEKYNVTMAQVAIAWHFAKGVSCPIIGGTKVSHLIDAVKGADLQLTAEDIKYLEEKYVAHALKGMVLHP